MHWVYEKLTRKGWLNSGLAVIIVGSSLIQ
jgi:hypothetical protein